LAAAMASLPSSARVETNAIFLPSGDQTGSEESDPLLSRESGVAAEPSVFASQILPVELLFALLLPSSAPLDPNATVRTAGAAGVVGVDLLPPQLVISNDNQRMGKHNQTSLLRDVNGI
jgi:hypothetical protein